MEDAECTQLIPRVLAGRATQAMTAYDEPTMLLLDIVLAAQETDPFVKGRA